MSTFTNNPVEKPHEEEAKEEEDHLEKPEETNVIRIGIIADTEVALGLLLVGIGYHHQKFRNYLMVENDTSLAEIEEFFHKLYKRPNIGIILLDYPTAKRLSSVLEKCKKLLPVVVILPTKASIVSYMEEKSDCGANANVKHTIDSNKFTYLGNKYVYRYVIDFRKTTGS